MDSRVGKIISHHGIFTFKEADNWILDRIYAMGGNDVCDKLTDKEEKSYYAKKYIDIIDNFIEKYNVNISSENNLKIQRLRSFIL